MASITKIVKTVTISPGESFTLPVNAEVLSITDVLDTTCNIDLPTPEELVEYNYKFALNQDNNDNHPMGSEVNIENIMIDGTTVPLSFTYLNTDGASANQAGVIVWSSEIAANNSLLSAQPVKFVSITWSDNDIYGGTDKQDLVTVILKMPASYQKKVFLNIRNNKFPNGIYLLGA